jgi:hypothetical protein
MKLFGFGVVCVGVVLPVVSASALALADGQAPQRPGHYDAPVVEIWGHPNRPLAAVEVAKLKPAVTLVELKQAFVARVGDAVAKDPF